MRHPFAFAGAPVEETGDLITYTNGDPKFQATEDDGTKTEAGTPLQQILDEAVNGEIQRISPLTGKPYTFSVRHLENADPAATYVVPRFGIKALPEPDGTPVRLLVENAAGVQHELLSNV